MENCQSIIKETTIYPGKRVVIIKRNGWYNVEVQEHKDICGGYVNDANADGWRTCSFCMRYTFESAVEEMTKAASRQMELSRN